MDRLPAWIVDDVEPEAQEAAKLAARKAGMSLGAWLSHTILSTAASELKRTPRDGNGLGSSSRPLPPALTSEVLLDSIQRLAHRIESAEAKTAASIQPLARKVTDLSRQIEDVNARATVSAAPMQRAMVRMAERLERLERVERDAVGRSNGRWRGLFPRHS